MQCRSQLWILLRWFLSVLLFLSLLGLIVDGPSSGRKIQHRSQINFASRPVQIGPFFHVPAHVRRRAFGAENQGNTAENLLSH